MDCLHIVPSLLKKKINVRNNSVKANPGSHKPLSIPSPITQRRRGTVSAYLFCNKPAATKGDYFKLKSCKVKKYINIVCFCIKEKEPWAFCLFILEDIGAGSAALWLQKRIRKTHSHAVLEGTLCHVSQTSSLIWNHCHVLQLSFVKRPLWLWSVIFLNTKSNYQQYLLYVTSVDPILTETRELSQQKPPFKFGASYKIRTGSWQLTLRL